MIVAWYLIHSFQSFLGNLYHQSPNIWIALKQYHCQEKLTSGWRHKWAGHICDLCTIAWLQVIYLNEKSKIFVALVEPFQWPDFVPCFWEQIVHLIYEILLCLLQYCNHVHCWSWASSKKKRDDIRVCEVGIAHTLFSVSASQKYQTYLMPGGVLSDKIRYVCY